MTDGPANFGDIFKHHAAGDRLAAIDLALPGEPRHVTYRELDEWCDAFARGLEAKGLGPGDRIALLALNRVEYIVALCGAVRAGCVPVPINMKLAPDVIEYIIRDSGTRIVFSEAPLRGLVPEDIPFIDFDGGFAEFCDPGSYAAITPTSGQVSMQPYTSGTTGRPKGVLLTHEGQLWAARTLVEYRRLRPDDRILISAPFFHKNALVAIKTALLPGACLVILPKFDVAESIRAIDAHRCTMTTGVPTMMYMILQEQALLAEADTSSIRTISMGSAPCSETLLDGLTKAFPQAEIHLNYGTTEGGPIMLGWYHPDGMKRPLHSVGYPIPGCEFKFVGGPDEHEGELYARNPGVARGYHNLPEVTADRFRDGWYGSGDIMRQDSDGWFYFIGRTDDMFVCGGENIHPGEVESLIETHPDIVQAAVLPFDDERKGQLPYAFVVARTGASVTVDSVKKFTIDNGPAYAHPRQVFFLSEIPLSGTNKIDRVALRAHAEQQLRQTGT
jgi:acyl-CoA synthetase (AMP-forming)/AMP-acid ligase II